MRKKIVLVCDEIFIIVLGEEYKVVFVGQIEVAF